MWVLTVVATAGLLASWGTLGLVSVENNLYFDTLENCTVFVSTTPFADMGWEVKNDCVYVEVDADGNVVE